jgi:hypothetical protein
MPSIGALDCATAGVARAADAKDSIVAKHGPTAVVVARVGMQVSFKGLFEVTAQRQVLAMVPT